VKQSGTFYQWIALGFALAMTSKNKKLWEEHLNTEKQQN
jgi:hypothetical protein